MPYTPILATLAYVLSPDGKCVLMIHRNAQSEDAHFGKYNGLGGKLEANENIVAGMKRELLEEAGIEVESFRLKGTVSWPGFGPNGEDWFGFIFLIDRFRGAVKSANPEGTLEWVSLQKIADLPLWEGDRYFLPLVFDANGPSFHAVMPYRDGRPVSWSYSTITNSE